MREEGWCVGWTVSREKDAAYISEEFAFLFWLDWSRLWQIEWNAFIKATKYDPYLHSSPSLRSFILMMIRAPLQPQPNLPFPGKKKNKATEKQCIIPRSRCLITHSFFSTTFMPPFGHSVSAGL